MEKFKKLSLLHPLLFALYPVLFLFSYNINHFSASVLTKPLLFSFGWGIVVYFLFYLILKKTGPAALSTSVFILLFFSYSRLKNPLIHVPLTIGFYTVDPDLLLSSCILLLTGGLIYLFRTKRINTIKLNQAFLVFSLVLISVPLYNTLTYEFTRGQLLTENLSGPEASSSAALTTQNPDIYYFILDRYAGVATTNDYGFDNSQFYDYLRQHGFFISDKSTSNYPKTFLSLTATFNMHYLDDLTQKVGGPSSDEYLIMDRLQNNQVVSFLKNRGYKYIHVGSDWYMTTSNPNANINYDMSGGHYWFGDEFFGKLLQTTMLSPVLERVFTDPIAVSEDPTNNEFRARILYEFNTFDQIPRIPGPKFVFAHIMIPHEPYVLGADCQPLKETVTGSRSEQENYLNQLQCANKKTEATIDKILANSKSEPIIILQSDEGPNPIQHPVSDFDWAHASDASIREKFPILNAQLLPGVTDDPYYPTVTSVNTFGILFNTYFHTDYPPLPDRNIIYQDGQDLYNFIDVTKRVKRLLGI